MPYIRMIERFIRHVDISLSHVPQILSVNVRKRDRALRCGRDEVHTGRVGGQALLQIWSFYRYFETKQDSIIENK